MLGFNPPSILPGVGFGSSLYPQHRQINPALLTSHYLQDLCISVIDEPKFPPLDPSTSPRRRNELLSRHSRNKSSWDTRIGNTVGIAHSFLTFLIGSLGGWAACRLASITGRGDAPAMLRPDLTDRDVRRANRQNPGGPEG